MVILTAISFVNIMSLIAWNFPLYISPIDLSELCTDARCFSLSVSYLSLSFFPYYIKGPWQTLSVHHWLKYIHLIQIVVSLKGLYTIQCLRVRAGARDKRSSSLWKGVTFGRKKFYNIGPWVKFKNLLTLSSSDVLKLSLADVVKHLRL